MSSSERCIVNLDRWYLRSLKRVMTWQCNKTYHEWLSREEWEQDRQFPLLLRVKVQALSPKQPRAPSNNHALSSSVPIWKWNSISLTHTAAAPDLSSCFSAGAQLIYREWLCIPPEMGKEWSRCLWSWSQRCLEYARRERLCFWWPVSYYWAGNLWALKLFFKLAPLLESILRSEPRASVCERVPVVAHREAVVLFPLASQQCVCVCACTGSYGRILCLWGFFFSSGGTYFLHHS